MSDPIIGFYEVAEINETHDGFPCRTQVAKLIPAHATHFTISGRYIRMPETYATKLDDYVYIFGQMAGKQVDYNGIDDVLTCEVFHAG